MDRNSEKLGVDQIDDNAAYQTDSNILDNEFTPAEQKRIIQRIDRRLVTTVGVMYCVSLMDRTNLGNAIIAGMGTELMLVGDRYVSGKPVAHFTATFSSLTSCGPVNHHSVVLRHLHHIPAAFDCHLSFHRPKIPSCGNHSALGRLYDRYGFRHEVGPTGRAQGHPGSARGWLLPQLRISPQHLVYEM